MHSDNTKLKKGLGLIEIFCLATGAMVSSGIFVLPGIAHAKAGPSVILSYLIAGVLTGIGMLSTAELATAMPKAGGDYFFITRTLGPLAGSISGLLNWFSLSLKSAFALVGLSAFASLYIDLDARITGAILCLIFVAVNLAGTKHAGRLQVLFVFGLLALMSVYVFRGLPNVEPARILPFFPFGVHQTLATAGFVFVSYGGLIQICGVAEEVRNPSRTIPLGIVISLVVVAILYALMVWVTTGVLPSEQLDGSLTPITDGASQFMGRWGVLAVSIAAILAFVSTANAGIMASSRYLFALSRDEMLPPGLSRMTKRTGVPIFAILFTGAFIMASLLLKLDILVEAASLVLLLGFMMSSVCVIVLRESRVQNYRPSFSAPLYPWLQIVALFGFGLLLFEMGVEAYLICAVLFVVGAVVYAWFGRRKVAKEFALMHLAERITSRDLVTGSLEHELKTIIRERDEIAADRFDDAVERCSVLDLKEQIDVEDCFKRLSQLLSSRLQVSEETLTELFLAREKESSTVLKPFLAVPHIIVPGEKRFEMALVRARAGIVFRGAKEPVHALFVLAGTRDERNFHLRALAAVAQIVQEPQFEKRWMQARGEQGIRDVVLLGRRQRGD